MADVRLPPVERAGRPHLGEAEPVHVALAPRHRHRDAGLDLGQHGDVVGLRRLLEEQRLPLGDAVPHLDRRGQIQPPVPLDHQLHVVAPDAAGGGDLLHRGPLLGPAHPQPGAAERVPLDRAEPHLDRAGQGLLERVRAGDALRRRPVVAIDRDAVAAAAPQQFVDRHAQSLALDVPQRRLDPRDRAAVDDAGAPVAVAGDGPGVMLHRERVLPQQVMRDRAHRLDHCRPAPLDRGVADAADAGIGLDRDDDPVHPVAVDHHAADIGDPEPAHDHSVRSMSPSNSRAPKAPPCSRSPTGSGGSAACAAIACSRWSSGRCAGR